jgi:tRNA(adenine34) deaminase
VSEAGSIDVRMMERALELAAHAAGEGEVPVGAVLFRGGEILGEAANARERDNDPTAHAEIVAIRSAARRTGSWRLDGCTLAVTLEPCPMCAGALVNARVARVVFGARDPKAGACGTLLDICRDPRLNHRLEVAEGVLADRCAALLTSFFAARRDAQAAGRADAGLSRRSQRRIARDSARADAGDSARADPGRTPPA